MYFVRDRSAWLGVRGDTLRSIRAAMSGQTADTEGPEWRVANRGVEIVRGRTVVRCSTDRPERRLDLLAEIDFALMTGDHERWRADIVKWLPTYEEFVARVKNMRKAVAEC